MPERMDSEHWRGLSPPTSPISNASSVLDDSEHVDATSFDDEEFANRFEMHSLAHHDDGQYDDGDAQYVDEDFVDGSYIDDEGDYYEQYVDEDEFGHITGADEVQEEPSMRLEEDLEVEDCDFDDDFGGNIDDMTQQRTVVNGRMITAPEAMGLRRLVFGGGDSSVALPLEAWKSHGLFFNSSPMLSFGLVQTEGGPCGPLAAIQGYVLRHLLSPPARSFAANMRDQVEEQGGDSESAWQTPSDAVQKEALVAALAHIIWTAGGGDGCVLALQGSSRECQVFGTPEYAPDGVTEKVKIFEINSMNTLESQLSANMSTLAAPRGAGILLMVYSVVLTRGLRKIQEDMDVDQPLVGHHGYANQELVNLMIFGQAHSNVFNGVKRLGDEGTEDAGGDVMILKGVPQKSDIGLLSLFEVYRSIQVGSYLKAPKFPIWIICSESHYSVACASALNDAPQKRFEQPFDIS